MTYSNLISTSSQVSINTNAPGTNTLFVNGPEYINGDLTATNLYAPANNLIGTLPQSTLPGNVVTNWLLSTNIYYVDPVNGSDTAPLNGTTYKTITGAMSAGHSNNVTLFLMPGYNLLTGSLPTIGTNVAIIGYGPSSVMGFGVLTNWNDNPAVYLGGQDTLANLTISNVIFFDGYLDSSGGCNGLTVWNVVIHNENDGDVFYEQNEGFYSAYFRNVTVYAGFDTFFSFYNSTWDNVCIYGNYTAGAGRNNGYCHVAAGQNMTFNNCHFESLGGKITSGTQSLIQDDQSGSGNSDLIQLNQCTIITGGTNMTASYVPTFGSSQVYGTYTFAVTNYNNGGTNISTSIYSGNGVGLTNQPYAQVITVTSNLTLTATVTPTGSTNYSIGGITSAQLSALLGIASIPASQLTGGNVTIGNGNYGGVGMTNGTITAVASGTAAMAVLSSSSANFAYLSVGFLGNNVGEIGYVAAGGQFFGDAAAGDYINKEQTGSHRELLGSGSGNSSLAISASSVMVNMPMILTNLSACPTPVANGGVYYPSNGALYWVTSAHTNLLSNK